ncbi:hypothetical protein [Kistimonas asteriae]|uniref:hypothetical protein n=1 Tax=Kistimonas asteriae TaxID=517724 RepID=UPI001BA60E84|nr:hypothetical protein [Kistimonas asteriae]
MMQLNTKINRNHTELNSMVDKVSSELRVEITTISCLFWNTFGGLITTTLFVFGVNWYFD